MRSPSDYLSVMRGTTISDVDLERLITGGDPEDTTLRDLAPLVARLRDQASRSPAPDVVASMSARAASLAITARPSAPTLRRRRGRGRMLPRFQPIGATAVILLVIGIGGTAYAADDAIPGEALYGLDRALESVGLGAGGADERIGEALALFEGGDTDGALEHAVEAIIAIEDEETVVATASQEAVLAAVATLDSDGGSGTRPEVMELLAYLSANVHRGVGDDGRAFGQRVAELARQIGSQGDGATSNPASDRPEPPTTKPDEGSGNGNQGNQGNQGQGNQGNQGNQGQGNQGNQGQGNGNHGQGNGNQGTSNDDQGASDDLADPADPAAPTDDPTVPDTSTTVGGNGNGNGNQGQGNGIGNGNGNGNQGQGNGNGNENQGQGNGNQGQGNGNGPPTESPSITAPGQLKNP